MGGLSPDDGLPVVEDAASGIRPGRRWAADPLPAMVLVGLVGLVVTGAVLAGAPAASAAWVVPALFAVVVAGLALSGST